jgi:hypothetical protein
MTPKEIYDAKRTNFIAKSLSGFNFLVTVFGYGKPVHTKSGYSDSITFKNESSNRTVQVYNAYHPVDYGFEINILNTSAANRNIAKEMVYYKPKEDQDQYQDYIAGAAEFLKNNYGEYLLGEKWFYDEAVALPRPETGIACNDSKPDTIIRKLKALFGFKDIGP